MLAAASVPLFRATYISGMPQDLTSTLNAMDSNCYHMGITHKVPLSTLSDSNASRPWQMYHDLAMVLTRQARKIVRDQSDMKQVTESIYTLDAIMIDLCLSLFPWAEFRRHKAVIKLHTLMDLDCSIPVSGHISDGRTHNVNALDLIPIQPRSIYIMDRGYIDFHRLYNLQTSEGCFVIRSKKNLQFYRKSSTPVDRSEGLRCDQMIRLTGPESKENYPQPLRRVRLVDSEHNQNIVQLTTIATGSAKKIGEYYKNRWQIELFFKWIKQYLRIKAFYGQSPNAVKTQIWTAICSYLIILIIQRTNHFNIEMHTMMQILSVAIMGRMTLKELFSDDSLTKINIQSRNQLGLSDF